MPKKTHPVEVNLLPKDPFSVSPIGKFITWALSVGRYIVVFTELIVILTFLSRFTLDRQLTDLNEDLLAKQALLNSYQKLEQDVRQIQAKGQFITEISQYPKHHPVLEFILDNLNQDITLSNINLNQDRVTISANAYSSTSLSTFVNTIDNHPFFSEVQINQINSSNDDTGIEFNLQAKLKT